MKGYKCSTNAQESTDQKTSLENIFTSIRTSLDPVHCIDEHYLLIFSLIQNAFFDQSQTEELLFDSVKYLFQSSPRNTSILEGWVQDILGKVLDQMNDENLARMLIILNFALDHSLFFDESLLLDKFIENLSYIFAENSDINALTVFVKLLMNNPSSIDLNLMACLYDQYQTGSFQTKIIIHPLIGTMYLFDNTFFTHEMTATLLAYIYEFSDMFCNFLSVAKCILHENADDSFTELSDSFISNLKIEFLDEIDLYYVNDFIQFYSARTAQ